MYVSRGEIFRVFYLIIGEGLFVIFWVCFVKIDMKGIKNNVVNIRLDFFIWKEEFSD